MILIYLHILIVPFDNKNILFKYENSWISAWRTYTRNHTDLVFGRVYTISVNLLYPNKELLLYINYPFNQ